MKYEKAEVEQAYENLLSNQSVLGVLFGSCIGAVMGAAFFLIFTEIDALLVAFLLIPGAIIGYFAQYLGRAFELKYRIIAGFMAFALHVFGCLYLVSIHPVWLFMGFPSAIIAMLISKVKLSDIEKTAIWRKQMNLS